MLTVLHGDGDVLPHLHTSIKQWAAGGLDGAPGVVAISHRKSPSLLSVGNITLLGAREKTSDKQYWVISFGREDM